MNLFSNKMKKFVLLVVLYNAGFAESFINQTFNTEQENLKGTNFYPKDFLVSKDVYSTESLQDIRSNHPHEHLDVVGIIKLYKYNIEIHEVETSDGYILEMHRITGNKKNPNPDGKPAVLLQHGILSSSADWVVAGPNRGFGFILADAGYDVWLGNFRGNKYSRKHKRLSTTDSKYWTFRYDSIVRQYNKIGTNWHEMGLHDLPTMVDHILQITRQEKLFYVGHSQGSTAFFVMTSELPEYNNKITAMFSLAPVAYCSNMFNPIFQALSKFTTLHHLTELIGLYEFKPSGEFYKKFSSTICQDNSIIQHLCRNVFFLLFGGFDKKQFDMTLLPAILAHVPAGAGVKQFVHYGQIMRSGYFRQFDFGVFGNLKNYRALTPPSYNLQNIKVPVALHYGINDWISNQIDIEKLYLELPNPIGKFRVPYDKFNHIDFLWAKDVKTLLYDKIMSLMLRYQNR